MMDDKTAVAVLHAYVEDDAATMPEYSVHMESIDYAIHAIETLGEIRKVLASHERNEIEQSEAFDKIVKLLGGKR